MGYICVCECVCYSLAFFTCLLTSSTHSLLCVHGGKETVATEPKHSYLLPKRECKLRFFLKSAISFKVLNLTLIYDSLSLICTEKVRRAVRVSSRV